MTDSATFLATIPDIQSAIKIGRDGMRLQLEVPEMELGEALQVLRWRAVVLKVTIEPET